MKAIPRPTKLSKEQSKTFPNILFVYVETKNNKSCLVFTTKTLTSRFNKKYMGNIVKN